MKTIILYYCIIIFGSWLLNLLHFSPNIGLMIMQIFDFLPFIVIPFLFTVKESKRILPNTSSFWVIIALFLCLSIYTTIYNGGEVFSAISHFGAMFRFTPLAFMIYILRPKEDEIVLFYRSFVFSSILLLAIGYIEIVGGGAAKNFFMPLTHEYSSAKYDDESLDINGIFPNSVDYAYFLVLSYIIISNKNRPHSSFILFLTFLIPIYFTGSKAALIIFILCTTYNMEKLKTVRNTFIGTIVICSSILIYQFWELFYWTVFIDSKASRLGYIIFTLPNFLEELSINTLIGVSPDRNLVFQKINSYPNAPMMTWDIDHMTSFEDEFYVALPIYYGIIGFGLLITLFVGMYRSFNKVRWKNSVFNYTIIIKSIFTILLIAPLFNQIIILKPFSIFFWCWIGILLTQVKQNNSYNRIYD